MRTNARGTCDGLARRLAATTGVLLATTAAAASAQEIEVVKLGHRNTIAVAILGSEGFDPDAVSREGWRSAGVSRAAAVAGTCPRPGCDAPTAT